MKTLIEYQKDAAEATRQATIILHKQEANRQLDLAIEAINRGAKSEGQIARNSAEWHADMALAHSNLQTAADHLRAADAHNESSAVGGIVGEGHYKAMCAHQAAAEMLAKDEEENAKIRDRLKGLKV